VEVELEEDAVLDPPHAVSAIAEMAIIPMSFLFMVTPSGKSSIRQRGVYQRIMLKFLGQSEA